MGDTKKLRKKYTTPAHPWNATRIQLEKSIMRKYGVSNKKEIWRMESVLKSFKDQAKSLLTRTDEQANKERRQLQDRMVRLGLISKDAGVDDILGLQLKDIMNRRLQTLVARNRLARSIKHARQLIVHEHIMVNGRKITSPSYIVPKNDESGVAYAPGSPYIQEEHPERYVEEIAARRMARQKARARREGVDVQEIVVFDPESIQDPEETKSKSYDASVADLKDEDAEKPKKKVTGKSKKPEEGSEEKSEEQEGKSTEQEKPEPEDAGAESKTPKKEDN